MPHHVEQIMTREPVRCSPDATLEHAEKLMLRHHTRRMLLADAEDRLVGLLTLSDIAQHQSPLESARWLRELQCSAVPRRALAHARWRHRSALGAR